MSTPHVLLGALVVPKNISIAFSSQNTTSQTFVMLKFLNLLSKDKLGVIVPARPQLGIRVDSTVANLETFIHALPESAMIENKPLRDALPRMVDTQEVFVTRGWWGDGYHSKQDLFLVLPFFNMWDFFKMVPVAQAHFDVAFVGNNRVFYQPARGLVQNGHSWMFAMHGLTIGEVYQISESHSQSMSLASKVHQMFGQEFEREWEHHFHCLSSWENIQPLAVSREVFDENIWASMQHTFSLDKLCYWEVLVIHFQCSSALDRKLILDPNHVIRLHCSRVCGSSSVTEFTWSADRRNWNGLTYDEAGAIRFVLNLMTCRWVDVIVTSTGLSVIEFLQDCLHQCDSTFQKLKQTWFVAPVLSLGHGLASLLNHNNQDLWSLFNAAQPSTNNSEVTELDLPTQLVQNTSFISTIWCMCQFMHVVPQDTLGASPFVWVTSMFLHASHFSKDAQPKTYLPQHFQKHIFWSRGEVKNFAATNPDVKLKYITGCSAENESDSTFQHVYPVFTMAARRQQVSVKSKLAGQKRSVVAIQSESTPFTDVGTKYPVRDLLHGSDASFSTQVVGGLVITPPHPLKVFSQVYSLDFFSCYPVVCLSLNLCFSTLLRCQLPMRFKGE